MESVNEKLRELQGQAIRLKFEKRDVIEDFFANIKKIGIYLQSAYIEKGYTPDLAKDAVLKFLLETHKNKSGLNDIATFDDAKKEISRLIVSVQKDLEAR